MRDCCVTCDDIIQLKYNHIANCIFGYGYIQGGGQAHLPPSDGISLASKGRDQEPVQTHSEICQSAPRQQNAPKNPDLLVAVHQGLLDRPYRTTAVLGLRHYAQEQQVLRGNNLS